MGQYGYLLAGYRVFWMPKVPQNHLKWLILRVLRSIAGWVWKWRQIWLCTEIFHWNPLLFAFMKIFVTGRWRPFSDTNNPKMAQNEQKMPFLTGLCLLAGWVEKWRQIWLSTTVFCIKSPLFAFILPLFENDSPFSWIWHFLGKVCLLSCYKNCTFTGKCSFHKKDWSKVL